MIKNYEDVNEILAKDYFIIGQKEKDEFVKFLFYWKSFANLYNQYATANAGERKMLADYLNHDDVMEMLYEQLDLNAQYFDVFLEYPVFDLTYDPGRNKEFYINKKLGDNWGLIRNETDKSIKNFQIIYSITGTTDDREFDEVMVSLFTTMYKLHNNVAHSYYGEIDELTEQFIKSSAQILDIVLPHLHQIRQELKI